VDYPVEVDGLSAIHIACKFGRPEVIYKLIKLGANIEIKEKTEG